MIDKKESNYMFSKLYINPQNYALNILVLFLLSPPDFQHGTISLVWCSYSILLIMVHCKMFETSLYKPL